MKKKLCSQFMLLALCGASAWANTSNCPTTNSANGGVQIPNSNINNDTTPVRLVTINALSTGFTGGVTAGGCFMTDQSFSNLAINGSGLNSGNTYAYMATGVGGDTITFSTEADTSNGNMNDLTNNFIAAAGMSSTFDLVEWSDFGTTATPSSIPGLVQVLVTLHGVVLPSTSSITITALGCSGVSGAGSTATLASCPGGSTTLGGNTTATFTSANIVGGNLTIGFFSIPSGITTLATDFKVTLNGVAGTASFVTFQEDFTTPEPATVATVSTALIGLGLIAYRRRRS